jgi:exosortase/archaeosortase family protein
VIISGIIGPRVISGGILFRDGFAVYGGVGKAAIFGLIAFGLLARRNKQPSTLAPWRPMLLGWMAASLVLLVVAWANISGLLAGERTLLHLALSHISLLLSVGCAALGCFGYKNVVMLWKKYKREIIGSIVIGIAFYFFLLVVYALWQPLASIVLLAVIGLLHVVNLPATLVLPNTLLFDKFGITVAEFCSGIESIALFTGLYAIVGLLDWNRLNKRRYFIVFPAALLGLFGLNIVRVFGLILAGYYINPEIAFSLFHTYAGLVFFILYSAIFWSIAYKYLLAKEAVSSTDHVS